MFKKNKLLFLVVIFSIIGLFIKLLFIYHSSVAFTYDQGRDLLDLRDMLVNHKIRLIGANTSLHGVFYGPFWYWVAFPFYILMNGSPYSTLIPILTLSFLMPIIIYLLVTEKDLGVTLALLYIFSYTFFGHSIVALNTNPMIFLTPLFVLLLAKFYFTEKWIYLALSYFMVSIFFHFEPIIGIFAIPFFVLSIFIFKKWKIVLKNLSTVIFFFIPFLPQLIFEIKHDFLQTKTLLALVFERESSLTAASTSIFIRFNERLGIFKNSFTSYFFDQNILALIGIVIVLISLIFILKEKKSNLTKLFYLLTLLFLFIVFVGFVFYPYALWPWYLGSVEALILTVLGTSFFVFFGQVLHKKQLTFLLIFIFVFFSVQKYFAWPPKQIVSEDTANLRNRSASIDIVYSDANGKGFKIYNFAPYIYDFPYQYLIWWQAKDKYGYLPEQYSYLDNQPVYVTDKIKADSLLPTRSGNCYYLIMEPFESQKDLFISWRGRFPEASIAWKVGKTTIEKICPN